MFDNHVHSSFSVDGVIDPGDACEVAIDRGLTGISFTEHLDYDYPGYPPDHFLTDFDKYMECMEKLKVKYNSKLKIIKAIEVGVQPHVLDDNLKIVNGYDFDFVLASIHIVNGENPYRTYYFENKSKDEAYTLYLKEILFMVNNFSNYDIVGHFDYVTRCATYQDRSMRYKDYSDLFDAILKKIILDGKGFEINTKTYLDKNDGMPAPEFDIDILKRYKELGGEMISFGSDAHSDKLIGYNFDYFSQILLDTGFKYIVHFENRKPVFDKL
jgi:histidinol-phosphatase (PHP family)